MTGRFILVVLAFSLASCNGDGDGSQEVRYKDIKEPLIKENIKITREEQRLIDRFIERRQWEMEETGTGLKYMIYQKGAGLLAKPGMRATVEYEITLLDGSLCYSSLEKGPRTFLIGRDNVEAGIHEAVALMHVGDRAKFVIPSYLAHGLSGDQNKIPTKASLVVDLHLIRVD